MIDLRSDVLGGVAPAAADAMLAAMPAAPAFDLGEDPHETALLARLADMFGFEDGLFVPTGTMANQIAVRIFCAPGETLIAERGAHVAVNEIHSTAGLNAAAVHGLDGERGHFGPAALSAALDRLPKSRADRHPRLVWLENTHNRAGGTVLPSGAAPAIAAICRSRGLRLHMDGARIWNALVAGGEDPRAIAAGVDTMTVNLGKALGAPIGAVLLGSRASIDEAVRIRRMFGGWWRPVGLLAAAAHAAVDGYRERIAADHGRARQLAAGLADALEGRGAVAEPETNIVIVELTEPRRVAPMLDTMRTAGVLALAYGPCRIRLVLHARIGDEDVVTAVRVIGAALAATDGI